MPKISVIVPVYKAEPYIHRCVDSILSQTYRDFDLILVDDGSPDRCGAICDTYARSDSRIHVIHQPNGGLSAARNAGIDWAYANSASEWLTFVDSDDYLHPTMFEALLNAAESYSAHISVCGYAETHGESLEIADHSVSIWTPQAFYRERNVNATVAWGKLYHKACFKEIRYPVGKIHEDEYVTYRILFTQEKLAFIDAPLYGYFINEAGITKSIWNPKRMDVFEAFEEQISYFTKNGYTAIARHREMGYIKNIQGQINRIQEQSNKRLYRQHMQTCRKKLREAIRAYKDDLHLNLIDHYLVFAYARPHLALWYRCLRKSQVLLTGYMKKGEK